MRKSTWLSLVFAAPLLQSCQNDSAVKAEFKPLKVEEGFTLNCDERRYESEDAKNAVEVNCRIYLDESLEEAKLPAENGELIRDNPVIVEFIDQRINWPDGNSPAYLTGGVSPGKPPYGIQIRAKDIDLAGTEIEDFLKNLKIDVRLNLNQGSPELKTLFELITEDQ